MQNIRKSFIALVVIVVALGFAGGVVGELWVNSFLLPDPYLSFKSYSDLSYKIDELIQGQVQKNEVADLDVGVNKAIQKARPTIASVYRFRNFSKNAIASLLPGDLLGQAVIITNNGWLVTSSQLAVSQADVYYVVTNDQKVYQTKKIIIDNEIGVAFLKIEANNLPVMEFKLRQDTVDGQAVFLFGPAGEIFSTSINNKYYSELNTQNDYIHSSEEFYKYIMLQEKSDKQYEGSPAIGLDGKMIGLVGHEAGLILPINHLTDLMKASVQGETWKRPYLGVQFYDLSEIINPEIVETKGAEIKAVKSDSPAKGLLLAQDIILKVESEELSATKNLTELISQYQQGETIKLSVKRNDQEQEISVKLAGKE